MTGGTIRLEGLEKFYDDVPAVRGIDLEIAAGEFFSLLGPSGCGKTSTLRMIAGFERPSAGAIVLDGVDLVQVPPHRRPVNTVFQNYALFPFLDVWHNIAFGLKYQHLDRTEEKRRVDDALAMVQMESFAKRKPGQLSGGQQQRVALARALVLGPSVLLLDEPLGALDAKLRKALQLELKSLQQRVGITFVYVTHDQEEALTMSDRLAVMADGRIEQVGTPEVVYSEPCNAYVAGFLGSANILEVDVSSWAGGVAHCRTGVLDLTAVGSDEVTGTRSLVIRPERIMLSPADGAAPAVENVWQGTITTVVYLGSSTQVNVDVGGVRLLVAVPNLIGPASAWYREGTRVTVAFAADAARILPG